MSEAKETIIWHNVYHKMPDDDLTVLAFMPGANEEVWLCYRDGDVWREVGSDVIDGRVTHWAEVPMGPKHTETARRVERQENKAAIALVREGEK